MIVEIHTAKSSIDNVSAYNENKMSSAYAEDLIHNEAEHKSAILAERNIPAGKTLLDEAERLRLNDMKNRRHGPTVKNITFHMSVNPSETDKKNDTETVVALVDDIMEGLGYKNQPYKIYRHNDIEREHYHVVSIRTGQDGKKINDSFERLKLRTILKELSAKYGFEIVPSDYEKKQARREEEEQPQMAIPAAVLDSKKQKDKDRNEKKDEPKKTESGRVIVPSFTRKGGRPVNEQLQNIHADAMKWSFTSFEQYQALLLRRYRVDVGIEGESTEFKHLVMYGTDQDCNAVTRRMTENMLGIKMLEQVSERISESEKLYRKEQKKRLEGLAAASAERCSSFEEYRALMEKKGVYVVVSWSKDGAPFGLTYLDRATRCGWKGSESSVDLKLRKESAEKKGWTISKDKYEVFITKRTNQPSRNNKLDRAETPFSKSTAKPGQRGQQQGDRTRRVKREPVVRIPHGRGAQRSNYTTKKKDALDHLEDELNGGVEI